MLVSPNTHPLMSAREHHLVLQSFPGGALGVHKREGGCLSTGFVPRCLIGVHCTECARRTGTWTVLWLNSLPICLPRRTFFGQNAEARAICVPSLET